MKIFLLKVLDTLLKVEYTIINPKRAEVFYMGFSVKQARNYAELTQVEVAQKLGISRDSYRKIELFPETASIAIAKKFSEVVGIPIDQIFFAENST